MTHAYSLSGEMEKDFRVCLVKASLLWSLAFLMLKGQFYLPLVIKKDFSINDVQPFQRANVFSWTEVFMLNSPMKEG